MDVIKCLIHKSGLLRGLQRSSLWTSKDPQLPSSRESGPDSPTEVLSHVFFLADIDLASILIISRAISSFKKICPLREVKPLEWNLSLDLRSLTCLPYEPLRLSSG